MSTDNNVKEIINEKLADYKNATSLMQYRKAISVLNKYHDPIISEAFWAGLRTKKIEDFPLVAFFATVAALESHEKSDELLEVFMQRWRSDYEKKILEDLTIHRVIEVIHIIINEAFVSFRDNVSLIDMLLAFFEKKTLYWNEDGLYKSIDSFKFFPKKLGTNVPQRLIQGLPDIIAKYFEQQLSEGKNNKEILTYIDFFTDKIGEDRVLQKVKKVGRGYKKDLFNTNPGKYDFDVEKGNVYAQTAMPFSYSEEFKELELRLDGVKKILNQLGSESPNLLLDISTNDIEQDIREKGIEKFLENRERFKLSGQKAIDVLEKLPPVVPAFVIGEDGEITNVLNSRYAKEYASINGAEFTLFGHTTLEQESQKMDIIDGIFIKNGSNHQDHFCNSINEEELTQLLDGLDSIVGEISVEVKRLETEKNSFIQNSLKEEEDFDMNPFLGFRGEKEREEKKECIRKKRAEYEEAKGREIVNAFRQSLKQRAIETIDNINSLSTLAHIIKKNNVIDRLANIKGLFAQSAEIIKEAYTKYPE